MTEKSTLDEVIERYVNNMRRTNRKENTLKSYITDYKIFKKYMMEEQELEYIQDVDEDILLDYRDYLYEEKNYKKATVNRKLNALKSLFAYLENLKIIDINYMKVIPTARPFDDMQKKEVLTPEELETLITMPNKLKDKDWKRSSAILYMLAFLGLRRGELLDLKIKDFDMNSKTIYIKRSKTNVNDILPINSRIFISLMKYLKTRDSLDPEDYLIQGDKGNRLSDYVFNKIVKKYSIKSGIDKDITSYTFRHTFVTNLVEEGLSQADIMKWTGHKDIRVLDVYTQGTPTIKNRVMNNSFKTYNKSRIDKLKDDLAKN